MSAAAACVMEALALALNGVTAAISINSSGESHYGAFSHPTISVTSKE
jgi:hypothetical protein